MFVNIYRSAAWFVTYRWFTVYFFLLNLENHLLYYSNIECIKTETKLKVIINNHMGIPCVIQKLCGLDRYKSLLLRIHLFNQWWTFAFCLVSFLGYVTCQQSNWYSVSNTRQHTVVSRGIIDTLVITRMTWLII